VHHPTSVIVVSAYPVVCQSTYVSMSWVKKQTAQFYTRNDLWQKAHLTLKTGLEWLGRTKFSIRKILEVLSFCILWKRA
jgi:hypothetical protein